MIMVGDAKEKIASGKKGQEIPGRQHSLVVSTPRKKSTTRLTGNTYLS